MSTQPVFRVKQQPKKKADDQNQEEEKKEDTSEEDTKDDKEQKIFKFIPSINALCAFRNFYDQHQIVFDYR